jgi:hypothetical protein
MGGMGGGSGGRGRSRGFAHAGSEAQEPGQRAKSTNAWKLLPDVWLLIKPRRAILAAGLLLMVVNPCRNPPSG